MQIFSVPGKLKVCYWGSIWELINILFRQYIRYGIQSSDGQTLNYLKKKFAKIKAICKGQFICMDWLNKPANLKKHHN